MAVPYARPCCLAFLFLLGGASDPGEQVPPACVGWGLVTFETGSARVNGRAAGILDNFVAVLRQSDRPSRITLVGHTDRTGAMQANLLLSRSRASAVRAFLIARGVAPALIRTEWAGKSRNLVDTPDGKADPNNRRVEFSETLDPEEDRRRQAYWAKHGRPTITC